MKALQVHYTSCRRGLSGHSGFQLRSHSAGLAAADLAEIEARNSYRPPLDAPASPTEEQLAQDFPTALRSYRLPSGAFALTRAVYAGKDYSGRWGNFFAHTLVIDRTAPVALGWPIDYFEWPGWVGRLAAAEDTDQAPEMLPALDFGDATSASFTCSELSLFLREEPAREGWLASMGQALFASQADRRALVIRSPPLDLPFWIGSLQKLFAPSLAWDWAISTYEDDPRQGAQICGTTGQTYFQFDESELRFRSYGFDVTSGARSEIGPIGRYAATTASWLCHQPEKLESYFSWSEVQGSLAMGDLEASLDLFRLLEGEDRALEHDTESLVDLAWRLPPDPQLPRKLLEAFSRLGKLPWIAAESALFRFLVERASETEPELAAQALDLWRDRALQGWLADPSGAERFEAFWRFLMERRKELFAMASRRWAADWRWLGNVGSSFSRAGLVPFVMAVGAAAGCRRIWRDPAVSSVFRSAAEGEFGKENLFVLAGRDGGDLLDLLDLLGRNGGQADRALGRALGKAIAAWPEAGAIRETLEEAEAWEVLFGEWLGRLDTCNDAAGRAAELARFERQVLSRLPKFKARAVSWIHWSVIGQSSIKEQIRAIHGWLADGSWQGFPPDLLRECLQSGQAGLNWDTADRQQDELARLLVEVARERKERFSPDRARLRLGLASGSASLGKRNLDEVFAAAEGLDDEENLSFLRVFLAQCLAAADRDAHEKLLAALDRPALRAQAPKAYTEALGRLDDEVLLKLVRFWLQNQSSGGLRGKIGERAEDTLVNWLAAHPAHLAEAEARFPRLRDAQPTWEKWLKRIGKRRRNPLVRMRSWCNGWFEKLPRRSR